MKSSLSETWCCSNCGEENTLPIGAPVPNVCFSCASKGVHSPQTNKPNINFEDKIYRPSHYTSGQIEVIDYIRDNLTEDKYIGYCIGNVIKYVSRYEHKNGIEDLEKAAVYLKWAINVMKGEGKP